MKGTKFSDVVKEYSRKLSESDLRYLLMRFNQRIGPDVAEAIDLLEQNGDLKHWLGVAKNATEFFDMIDTVDHILQNESRRRFNVHDAKDKTRSAG